jgi:CRP/FNR family transcriptional regulator, cyclic AMP receptor protein
MLAPVRRHLPRGVRRSLPAGAFLIVPGEPCHAFAYIESGLIQSTLLRSGGEHVIVERIGPGSICGEGPCLHGQAPSVEMVAIEPSDVVLFDRPLMVSLFREDPAFALAIAQVLSVKYHRLLARFGAVTDRRPAERLVELLDRLGRHWGEPHPRGRLIRTHLTHEDMAAMTGLSRVTVTRSIAGLRRTGMLDIVDGDYLLLGDAAAAGR